MWASTLCMECTVVEITFAIQRTNLIWKKDTMHLLKMTKLIDRGTLFWVAGKWMT